MKHDKEMILSPILGLLDTACQASLELLELLDTDKVQAVNQLLDDLQSVVHSARSAREFLASQLEHAHTEEMLENIEDTLADIRRSLQTGNVPRAAMKTEYQLYPFLRQLWESFYYWCAVYPDPERMEQYYREEFAQHWRNPYLTENEKGEKRLTIVLPAYNHLETTKRCVEQLLKVTDFEKLDAELILIDHGSTDGTLSYFESIGVGKVIHFKRNVRMYMFTTMAQVCQSEYFVFLSNDVLVTKDWAEILLNCMESDEKIIAAVPATPNIANLQMLHAPTNDAEEFMEWANKQNHSDPARWNDRARLMPPVGIYRTAAVSKIGFADPSFYSMEFWDDDFSLRARRAGYRQLVCDDVACYHFGSVTGRDAQQKEGTLVYGRKLFLNKHGVDAWGNGFCYDYQAVRLMMQTLLSKNTVSFLGIDCGFGDTPLQIQNELRHLHKECKITNLTCQKEYISDLQAVSDVFAYSENLGQFLDEYSPGSKFDAVYVSRDISEYPDIGELLHSIHHKLTDDGILFFSCRNPFYALTLHALLQLRLPENTERFQLANPDWVAQTAGKIFSAVQRINVEQQINGLDDFVKQHYGKISGLPQIMQKLATQQYYFICRK